MPWEDTLAAVLGFALSYLLSFIEKWSSKQKSMAIAAVAFFLYGGGWFLLPGLSDEHTLNEVLKWALVMIGSGHTGYAVATPIKRKLVGHIKSKRMR